MALEDDIPGVDIIGRGTIMIANECKKVGLKTPTLEISEQIVKLHFFSDVKRGGYNCGSN